MARTRRLPLLIFVGGTVAAYWALSKSFGGDIQAVGKSVRDSLGPWAMPVFVLVHSIALALCFPWAIAFEAAATYLFGFVRGVACVFCAKITGAALAFWIGRTLFNCSVSASSWVKSNKYFSIVNKGVAKDGWKFVLMARFSPIPSYIINYALAATDVRFFVDFLLPTIVGGLPMILQNTSFGSLTSAATKDRSVWSYAFPCLGILSGIFISWRIKKYVSLDFSGEFAPSTLDIGGDELTSGKATDGELLTAIKKATPVENATEPVKSFKRRVVKSRT